MVPEKGLIHEQFMSPRRYQRLKGKKAVHIKASRTAVWMVKAIAPATARPKAHEGRRGRTMTRAVNIPMEPRPTRAKTIRMAIHKTAEGSLIISKVRGIQSADGTSTAP